jgi:ATP-dependent Clp protease adapter protein ClpS
LLARAAASKDAPDRAGPEIRYGGHSLAQVRFVASVAGGLAFGRRWWWPTVEPIDVFVACLDPQLHCTGRALLRERGVTRRAIFSKLGVVGTRALPPDARQLAVVLLNNRVASFENVVAILTRVLEIGAPRAEEIALAVHRSGAAQIFAGPRADAIARADAIDALASELDVPLEVQLTKAAA